LLGQSLRSSEYRCYQSRCWNSSCPDARLHGCGSDRGH
jgi:hypothetical protein